jgi:hypothetical protein
LPQVPTILREIPEEQINQMRKSAYFFYERYFISIKKLVQTSVEVF